MDPHLLDDLADPGDGRSGHPSRAGTAAHVTPLDASAPVEHDADDDTPRLVRPYALTGGRTRPTHDLPIEVQVTATPLAEAQRVALAPEQRRIIELCESPIALAEIAALARLPLGVVRVLVGDLREDGLVVCGRVLGEEGADAPPPPNDIALLERVLHGLRSL